MALSNEDKKDISKAMGKALAKKVAKVTRDKVHDPFSGRNVPVKRAKVKMGGTTTRNGEPHEVGMSKEWKRRFGEFKRKSPELKEARKGYNEQLKRDGRPTKRGAFGL